MSDHILNEIQEEINRDRMNRFFKKNGKALIILLIIGILALGAYEAYKQYDIKERTKAGDMLYEVAADAQNPNNSVKLDEIAKNASYKELALLNKASFYIRTNNNAEAKKSYSELAAMKNGNPAFTELAELNVAVIKLNENAADKSAEELLKKLSSTNGIYKFSALEILGAYYKKQGKNTEAKATFKKIIDDEKAPESISGRAKALINSF